MLSVTEGYHARQNTVTGLATGQRIKLTSVLVIGAGAAGNEILKNLALMGFGKITIIDFDHIEDSNLSRTVLFSREDINRSKAEAAAERLMQLMLHESPLIRGIHGNVMTDLGKGEFVDHDLTICCVDTMKARAYINDWCVALNRPFFEIGFKGMNADITFIDPGLEEAPNLRDLIGYRSFDSRRNSCTGLIVNDTALESIPTIQSISAVAGGLLTTEIIKYLKGDTNLAGKTLKYYGQLQETDTFKLRKSEKASLYLSKIDYVEIPFSEQSSIREILTYLNETYNDYFVFQLPYDFLESVACRICGQKKQISKWKPFVFDRELFIQDCHRQSLPEGCKATGDWVSIRELHLDLASPFLDKPLAYFGIPPRDLLSMQGINGESRKIIHVLLSKNANS